VRRRHVVASASGGDGDLLQFGRREEVHQCDINLVTLSSDHSGRRRGGPRRHIRSIGIFCPVDESLCSGARPVFAVPPKLYEIDTLGYFALDEYGWTLPNPPLARK
jgi:hypothetical protein